MERRSECRRGPQSISAPLAPSAPRPPITDGTVGARLSRVGSSDFGDHESDEDGYRDGIVHVGATTQALVDQTRQCWFA